MTDQMLTGGQILVRALEKYGVKTVFGVAGESYLAALDALYDSDIRFVTNRQEGGAVFMAEAYAKMTGHTGICFVTRGPGATNGAIGVHTARQDSTPLIYFIGQVARDQEGREAFQEIDYRQMFKPPIAKAVFQIDRADEIAKTLADAFYIAEEGRKGPVVIALPEDMLTDMSSHTDITVSAQPKAQSIDLSEVENALKSAKKPVVIIGGSGWDADSVNAVERFAEASNLPVVTSFRRQDLFDHEHKCYAGELGTGANPALVAAIRDEADVIIAINTRVGEIASQGYTLMDIPKPRQTLIHMYPDTDEFGKVYAVDIAITARPMDIAPSLAPIAGDWADWTARLTDQYQGWSTIGEDTDTRFAVDMTQVFKVIRETVPDDTIYTTDAGNFNSWTQRYLRYSWQHRMIAPTSGAMGYGFPAAIAASLAEPKRKVIGMVGDGGFMMTGQELSTAMQSCATPILIIFNNGIYGTIRMHQERDYPGRTIATDLHNPDFTALAKAYGAETVCVKTTEEFEPAFKRALSADTLYIIEVQNDAEQITANKTLSEFAGR